MEIEEVFNSGITVFGENYVQEFLPKYEELTIKSHNKISWHLIGHLQKNKVKYITGKIDLIHSVDDIDLAATIDKQSSVKNIVSNILIEVNLAGESTKNGVESEGLSNIIKELRRYNSLQLLGLMTMPPLVNEPEENRKYFKELKELLKEINRKNIYKNELHTLSMGTSGDFEVAIEEGATIVRVGTVIFGKRPQI